MIDLEDDISNHNSVEKLIGSQNAEKVINVEINKNQN